MNGVVREAPEPVGRRRRPGWAVRIAGASAAACAVVIIAIALCWPRTTVVKVLKQPADVAYIDNSAHVAVLKHVRAPIAAVQLYEDNNSTVNHYEVVLGRDPGGQYGHHIRIDVDGSSPRQLTVEWTTEGAWLDYQSGYRLFVPAKYFIGGR